MQQELWIDLAYFSGVDQSNQEMANPPHSSPDAQNMAARGAILATAPGYSRFTLTPLQGEITSLIPRYSMDPEQGPSILALAGTTLYRLDAYQQWSAVQAGAIGSYDYLNYSHGGQDLVIMGSGIHRPWVWQGSSVYFLGDCDWDLGTFCLHYERVWGAQNGQHPERVWFSEAYDPMQWTTQAAGFIDLPGWTGSRILALKSFFNEVVVFKEHEVFRIFGTTPNDFAVAKVVGDCGPANGRAITACNERLYFFTSRGFATMTGCG